MPSKAFPAEEPGPYRNLAIVKDGHEEGPGVDVIYTTCLLTTHPGFLSSFLC